MKSALLISVLAIGLAACAKSPDAIAPVAMPDGSYERFSCPQLAAERTAVAAQLAALEADQRSAVAGDAVGVFLVGVPFSSVSGGDKAGLIAVEKGKMIALDARLQRC
jgi:opacity protein-like surface antigen